MKSSVAIVHLGNIGIKTPFLTPCQYTEALARAHPQWNYFGIDRRPWVGSPLKNYQHLQLDFLEGLKRFPDNSLDIVSTQLALGYYDARGEDTILSVVNSPFADPEESMMKMKESAIRAGEFRDTDKIEEVTKYTASILELALQKLAPGKPLHVVTCALAMNIIVDAAKKAGIENYTVKNAFRYYSHDRYSRIALMSPQGLPKLNLLRFKVIKP